LTARISACSRIGTPSTWSRLEIFSAPFTSLPSRGGSLIRMTSCAR